MKQEIADKWVKALSSGKYVKGKYHLCQFGQDGKPDKYCCLGVLCELYIDETGDNLQKEKCASGGYVYDSSQAYLTNKVMDWSGIKTVCGAYTDANGRHLTLSYTNDNSDSFNKVIEIIKEKVEEL